MKDHTTAEIFEELWKRIEYDANVSEELASESNELQERIDKAIEYINRVITIIKEQPRTDIDDFWILEKLQIFLDILEESDKE